MPTWPPDTPVYTQGVDQPAGHDHGRSQLNPAFQALSQPINAPVGILEQWLTVYERGDQQLRKTAI